MKPSHSISSRLDMRTAFGNSTRATAYIRKKNGPARFEPAGPTSDDGLIENYINGGQVETQTEPTMYGATQAYFDFGIYKAFISECACDVMPTQVV